MNNLEQNITEWRKTMASASDIDPDTLDELENHLRETVAQLVRSGVAGTEAFHRAVSQLGAPLTMAPEFQKLAPPTWMPVKVVTGIGAILALALTLFLLAPSHQGHRDLLLATHVFTVTLGYSATILLGMLGICYVCQRCRSDLSPRRLQSLCKAGLTYARLAAFLVAVGMVLGMAWSQIHRGRFWTGDPKEVGGLCIMVWLLCFLFAHRFRQITHRGLLLLTVLGSAVTWMGWFAPLHSSAGTHSYGMAHHSWLMIMVLAHLLFVMVGLAPAAWLQLRKT